MTRVRTRFGCSGAAVLAALLLVWYAARFNGPWSAHGADFHLALVEVRLPSAVAMWQHRSDASRIAVIWIESGAAQPKVLFIDRRTGRQQQAAATFEQLRREYQPYEDAFADRAVEVRFRGLNIPRPRPYLFGYPEPSGPGIALQPSLFGSVSVIDRVTGRVLLSRVLVNGDRVHSPFELARVAPLGGGLALVECVPGSNWNVWLFDRPRRTAKHESVRGQVFSPRCDRSDKRPTNS